MSAGASPYALLVRSIERRSLAQAEAAARELGWVDNQRALALALLMRDAHDSRFDRAAARWLARWSLEEPAATLEIVGGLAVALRDMDGTAPEVARSRAALLLRSAGSLELAQMLERW